jgi:hypothetical protein
MAVLLFQAKVENFFRKKAVQYRAKSQTSFFDGTSWQFQAKYGCACRTFVGFLQHPFLQFPHFMA